MPDSRRALRAKAPKTVNNVLSVLSTLLKAAVEWKVIERVPCAIRLVRVSRPLAVFHDFEAYERLVEAASATGSSAALVVLLGGEAQLAMRGAPGRAIQELAGHTNIITTQRYMHLRPAAIEAAIRLLDAPVGGEIGETGKGATGKSSG